MLESRLVLMKLKKALMWEYRPCFVCCFPPSVILLRKERTCSDMMAARSQAPPKCSQNLLSVAP